MGEVFYREEQKSLLKHWVDRYLDNQYFEYQIDGRISQTINFQFNWFNNQPKTIKKIINQIMCLNCQFLS